MKITVIPFLIGAYVAGYFLDNYEFANGAAATIIVLAITKNIDWI